jgi:hypothetical protein
MRVDSVRILCGIMELNRVGFGSYIIVGAHKLNESVMHSYLSLWELGLSHKRMVSTIISKHIIMKVIYITMILGSFIK